MVSYSTNYGGLSINRSSKNVLEGGKEVTLYMAIDNDNIGLPVCVEESVTALAEKTGVGKRSISSMMCRNQVHRILGLRFVKVQIEEGDEE